MARKLDIGLVVLFGALACAAPALVVRSNAERHEQAVKGKILELSPGRVSYAFVGATVFYPYVSGAATYSNPEKGLCHVRMERHLDFWGKRQIGEDHIQQECGLEKDPLLVEIKLF